MNTIGNFTIHLNNEDVKHVYDEKVLESYIQWSKRDINNLKEFIECAEKYQQLVKDQLTLVSSTETVPHVHLKRMHMDKIEFYVEVRHMPKINMEGIYDLRMKITDQQKFVGRDRSVALKYAEFLAKKHNCEIKKVGFKK